MKIKESALAVPFEFEAVELEALGEIFSSPIVRAYLGSLANELLLDVVGTDIMKSNKPNEEILASIAYTQGGTAVISRLLELSTRAHNN